MPGAMEVLVGNMLGMGLYGAYLPICYRHGLILYERRRLSWAYLYHLSSMVILFVIVTLTMASSCILLFAVLFPSEQMLLWSVFGLELGLAICMLNVDLFLVYRVYVVYFQSIKVAAFPLLVWTAFFAATAVYWSKRFKNILVLDTESISPELYRAQMLFSLCLNFLCACMIVFQIWCLSYQENRLKTISGKETVATRAMRIMVETAAAWMLWLGATSVTGIVHSDVNKVFCGATQSIMGIVFSTIIVRTVTGSSEHNPSRASLTKESAAPSSIIRRFQTRTYSSDTTESDVIQLKTLRAF